MKIERAIKQVRECLPRSYREQFDAVVQRWYYLEAKALAGGTTGFIERARIRCYTRFEDLAARCDPALDFDELCARHPVQFFSYTSV